MSSTEMDDVVEMMASYLPRFDSVQGERLHRKQRLAASLRLFGKFGFDEGVAGHVTARDPERLDHFWVNPFGAYFGNLRTSDLILVDHQGSVVEGSRPVNAAAFAIHSPVHAARPDVVAAAHALADQKAVILRNHGLLTVGRSVDEAVWWFITMERTCQAQLLAEAAGTPVKISDAAARLTAGQVGSHLAGWFSFSPLYATIVADQPDLLD